MRKFQIKNVDRYGMSYEYFDIEDTLSVDDIIDAACNRGNWWRDKRSVGRGDISYFSRPLPLKNTLQVFEYDIETNRTMRNGLKFKIEYSNGTYMLKVLDKYNWLRSKK
jgi:hypothetical protein